MGKVIGGAVAGYVVMFLAVFGLMSGAWAVLGAGGAFRPGSWQVTGTWVALSIVIGLAAAVAGGYVCAAIAKDPRAPRLLAIIVLVLGVLFAIPVLTGGGPEVATPRPDDLAMFEAMNNAKSPVWAALLNPILGVVGVLLGANLRKPGITAS